MADQQLGDSAFVMTWGLRQLHDRLQVLVSDLSDELLRWSPMPGAHCLAFALWHIARCDDNYLRAHVQGRPEIWDEEGWAERWGMDSESTGMLLSDEEATDLVFPPKEDILAYAQRVWREVEDFVAGLDPEEMAQTVSHVERTTGLSRGQLIITHIYGHDNRHMGEMEYIKGLLGLRGSITL